MSYIYVASPYTDSNKSVEETRFRAVEQFCAGWTQRGVILYSPIVHFHKLANMYDLPTTAAFWREHNTTMLRFAKELWVYTIEGWDQSTGVGYEISTAQKLLIPVHYKKLPGWKETENVTGL